MITEIDGTKCSGCGICVDICNMDVLRLDPSSGKTYIAYPEDCMTCYECALKCPEQAIEVFFTPEFTPPSIEYLKGGKRHG